MSLQNEGSIVFQLSHQNPEWQADNNGYNFGPFAFQQYGLVIAALKHPDKQLDITISGPFQQATTFRGRIPELVTRPDIHVAITWVLPTMKLYINGEPVAEISFQQEETQPLVRATMPIVIRGHTPSAPPQQTVDEVVNQLFDVYSTIEAFFDASDISTLETALQSGLERTKFRVQESGVGSWRGILAGTRRAFEFSKDKLATFFAILAGKGERLAEAYVKGKEAEVDEKQSDAAAAAKEKVKQEQIETLKRGMEVAKELRNQIADLRADLPADHKAALLERYFLPSMERVGILLLENNLELDLSPDQATEA